MIFALLLSLIIWGLIFYVCWWGIAQMAIPDPFNKVIRVILVLAVVIIVIGLLMGNIPPFAFLSSALNVK